MNRTKAFRHPAFHGRRIIVTATGQFFEAHTGNLLGTVGKIKNNGAPVWQKAGNFKTSGPSPAIFVYSDWLPLIKKLKKSH